jgi:hypothetical protein
VSRPPRASRPRASLRDDERKRKNAWGGAMIACVIGFAGLVGYFQYTNRAIEIDPASGCPRDGAVSLTAVIIDGSDPIAPRQQAFLRNHLETIKAEIPRHGALAVYALGTDMQQLLDPVVLVCNPGRGRDVNPLTGSPLRTERLWEEAFHEPLQGVFDAMIDPDVEEISPIFESVQSVAISHFSHPAWRGKPRTLVLISDLLQFTPEFSHYRGPGDFAAFRQSAYYRRVRTDLRGVEVVVFYVPRATRNNVQGERHLAFWRDYFLDQGARPGGPALFVHVEG